MEMVKTFGADKEWRKFLRKFQQCLVKNRICARLNRGIVARPLKIITDVEEEFRLDQKWQELRKIADEADNLDEIWKRSRKDRDAKREKAESAKAIFKRAYNDYLKCKDDYNTRKRRDRDAIRWRGGSFMTYVEEMESRMPTWRLIIKIGKCVTGFTISPQCIRSYKNLVEKYAPLRGRLGD